MSIIRRMVRTAIFTPLFALPNNLKLKMSGGNALVIAGRTLNIDNQLLAANASKGPQLDTMPPQKARDVFRKMTAIAKGELSNNILINKLVIPVEGGEITARLYCPNTLNEQSALLIYFHGGGNVIGDLDSYEVIAGEFAEQLHIRVLAVDYRLAPEHKFPTAAHDAYAAYCWARKNAQSLKIDCEKIILAGDSAGGYLSAVTSLQAIQQGTPLPKAQVLIYPMCDMSTQRESYHLFADGLVLTKKLMDYFINHYINDEADKKNPLASPLLAKDEELKQMPTTLLTIAGFDPLCDEGLAFYKKLSALNVDITLLEHLDLTHGFITLTGVLKRGNDAKNEIIAETKSLLK